jgi:uncharacterized protein YidB (DUF937 family)
MSDVLSRMLANALGGMGGGQGSGPAGGSPLGEPRMPTGGARGGSPDLGGLLGGMMGGGQGGAGGGLGGLLGGLLGGMAGGAPSRGAPGGLGGGLGGLAGGMGGGIKGAALMALLAYLMQGRGGTAGLSSLTDTLRRAGLGQQVDSWVGPGANHDLRPEELARAIPPEAMDEVERATGLGRDDVLSQLSRGLPGMVNRLTPQGRMPERDEELDGVDEQELLGNFGVVPGEAYGKFGPGDGGRKG